MNTSSHATSESGLQESETRYPGAPALTADNLIDLMVSCNDQKDRMQLAHALRMNIAASEFRAMVAGKQTVLDAILPRAWRS